LRIALAQINPVVGALKKNAALMANTYGEALSAGAGLVIFPELAVTGYPPMDLLLYSGFLQQVERMVTAKLAPLTAGGPAMLLGAPWRFGGTLYNCALLLENGAITSVHRKTLLTGCAGFDEHRHFAPSPRQEAMQIGGLTAAIAIGEEIWGEHGFYPRQDGGPDPVEELARLDAALLIKLSASPYLYGKHAWHEKTLARLAAKSKTPIIYLNQVGGNDTLIFDGTSLVYNNRGELIRRAASFETDLLYVESEALFAPARQQLAPLADNIETIYRALRLGIKDYMAKTGFKSVVLGLSGGLDSAVVAALAVDALGPENVLGLLLPSPYSSSHSVEDAGELAGNLGIRKRVIPIEKPFEAFLDLCNPGGSPLLDLAEENLQARIRGTLIMLVANREGRLVLTTSNKSELSVGYCTLYGDMAGALAVLADIPKTMVYDLAEYINRRQGKEIIPRRTITKPPSAELRPDQKDEDSLPPYRELDPILELYLEKNMAPEEIIAQGYNENTVYKVVALVDRSEYKRRQAAPGLQVSSRAFGAERRMPVARGYDYLEGKEE